MKPSHSNLGWRGIASNAVTAGNGIPDYNIIIQVYKPHNHRTLLQTPQLLYTSTSQQAMGHSYRPHSSYVQVQVNRPWGIVTDIMIISKVYREKFPLSSDWTDWELDYRN